MIPPSPAANAPRTPPRFAIFTHDTFGLGHVRRSLHFVNAITAAEPGAAVLLVSGSPAVQMFRDLPPTVDFVKIPTIAKTGSRELRPPHLPIPQDEVALLRERIIRETLVGFAPDVLLVDNFPLGSGRDLLPALGALRDTPTRTVLGIRDVLDSPEVVRKDWERRGLYQILDRCYERILVYGSPEVMRVEEAYDLPPSLAERVRYCGYVTSDAPLRSREEIREEIGAEGPLVLVTGGGGGDGHPLLQAYLDGAGALPPVTSLVVTGPLMNAEQRRSLRDRDAGTARVVLREFLPDLRSYIAAADLVVSMCGYNTAAEIVATGTPALVVPRTWRYGEHLKRGRTGQEWEQILRARALERLGVVEVLEPEALTPAVLAERVSSALAGRPDRPRPSLDLGGAHAVTRELLGLLDGRGLAA